MLVEFYDGISHCHSRGSSAYADHREEQDHLLACVGSWNSAELHRKMDNRLFVVALPDQYRCGEEGEIDWLVEGIVVTFSCLSVLGRSPLKVFARYVRGLHTFPSLILHVLRLYSIIYRGASQSNK